MTEHRNNSLGFSTTHYQSHKSQREQRAKREATQRKLNRLFALTICAMITACIVATLYLIAAGTLPLLSGMIVTVLLTWCGVLALTNHSHKGNRRGV